MSTIALAGDVMLGRGVSETLRYRAPDEPWGDVLPLLLAADLRLVNLECAITLSRQRWLRTPKEFHFRAEPRAVDWLRAARIDGCSLANNHTLDFEVEGLLDTLRYLDAGGIAHAGAGRDFEEASDPAVFEVGATRVALLAVTDNEPDFAAGPGRPGTRYLPVSLEPEVLDQVERAIARARAAGAELVIFSDHWGPNMVPRPSPLFRAFAHAVMDLGADVFFGHSAHVVQGIELYRGRPILYDTGDFLDDYVVDPELHNDWSFLFELSFAGRVFRDLKLWPVQLTFAKVQLARGTLCTSIMARMQALSAELGTQLTNRGDHLALEPALLSTSPARPPH